MIRRLMMAAVFGVVLLGSGFSGPEAAAQTVTLSEFETAPNADVAHPAGIIGDVWTFVVPEPGAPVRIGVDTRDDNGDGTSNLDPVAFLFDETGATFFGVGDDEVSCTRAPVCGFACPQIGPLFLPPGTYKVVIRDFDTATATDAQCIGGAYVLSVAGPVGQVEALTLVSDDKDVTFDPETDKKTLTHLMSQTTAAQKREALRPQNNE